MRTDKIRKYLIPNIPYLFILWAFLKLGTAYRLAAGNDFAHKLIGLGQTIGPAFADFAPGLAPLDWLVGIVGAVGFRLLIYFKSKNAKKFRRDAEYGSARWGTEKDIKPFVDPKFENNVILTGTEFLTMNTRPKIPANARNLNCCIIGSSGSGKTRFWLTPQLLQAHSSYPDWNIDMLITLFTPILTQPAEKPVTERSAYKAHKSTYQQVAGIMYSQVRTGIARYHRP